LFFKNGKGRLFLLFFCAVPNYREYLSFNFVREPIMEKISVDAVKQQLESINYPGFNRDILSFGILEKIELDDLIIKVYFKFATHNEAVIDEIKKQTTEKLSKKFPQYQIQISQTSSLKTTAGPKVDPANDPWAGRMPIPGIKNIMAIASGKGGVGKSTVSTNLAIVLAREGLKIGLMDSDIYGPSIHIMMGIRERPMVNSEQKIIPIEKYGIKMMSMGFLVDSDAPLIWRGPLIMKAVEQFLRDVIWGELDILVIDLPPGTGDAQLTLVQKTPITGAIIVTTPQEVSLIDARRGLKMFQKVNTTVVGIVENMSFFVCPECKHKEFIFGEQGGLKTSKELGVPLLGQIPIESDITRAGDEGTPIVMMKPESLSAKAYNEITSKIIKGGLFSI
jgi:ATP-binding protein involved in chromosome partitioning